MLGINRTREFFTRWHYGPPGTHDLDNIDAGQFNASQLAKMSRVGINPQPTESARRRASERFSGYRETARERQQERLTSSLLTGIGSEQKKTEASVQTLITRTVEWDKILHNDLVLLTNITREGFRDLKQGIGGIHGGSGGGLFSNLLKGGEDILLWRVLKRLFSRKGVTEAGKIGTAAEEAGEAGVAGGGLWSSIKGLFSRSGKVAASETNILPKRLPTNILKSSKFGSIARFAPWLSGGVAGYQDYAKNKNPARAAVVGTGAGLGTWGGIEGGAALGAAVGAAAGPLDFITIPLGALVGGAIGGYEGGNIGGGVAGYAANLFDFTRSRRPSGTTNDDIIEEQIKKINKRYPVSFSTYGQCLDALESRSQRNPKTTAQEKAAFRKSIAHYRKTHASKLDDPVDDTETKKAATLGFDVAGTGLALTLGETTPKPVTPTIQKPPTIIPPTSPYLGEAGLALSLGSLPSGKTTPPATRASVGEHGRAPVASAVIADAGAVLSGSMSITDFVKKHGPGATSFLQKYADKLTGELQKAFPKAPKDWFKVDLSSIYSDPYKNFGFHTTSELLGKKPGQQLTQPEVTALQSGTYKFAGMPMPPYGGETATPNYPPSGMPQTRPHAPLGPSLTPDKSTPAFTGMPAPPYSSSGGLPSSTPMAETGATPKSPIIPGGFIKKEEGLVLHPYGDVGHTAIGYGHDITARERQQGYIQTDKGRVPISGRITKEQANAVYQKDIETRSAYITKAAPGFDKLNQNQQQAIMDYYYNTGRLPRNLRQNLASGDTQSISNSLRHGIATVHGRPYQPLITRRGLEADLFNQTPATVATAATAATSSDLATGTNIFGPKAPAAPEVAASAIPTVTPDLGSQLATPPPPIIPSADAAAVRTARASNFNMSDNRGHPDLQDIPIHDEFTMLLVNSNLMT